MTAKGGTARIASVISVFGHPLLTMSAFLLYVGRRGGAISLAQSMAVIVVVIVPLALWNLRQTRSGSYANFDVSVRTERHSMYLVLLALLTVALVGLSLANKAFPWRAGLASVLVMLVAAAVANRRVKISLHTAFSFYIAMVFLSMDGRLAAAILVLSTVVAISRVVLQRHTVAEIVFGAILGTVTGACLTVVLRATAL